MFETFNVPSLYLTTPARLSLFASYHGTNGDGIVVDCGYGITDAVPIVNGNLPTTNFLKYHKLIITSKLLVTKGK